MEITFPGYNRSGTLTNFPALVILNQQVHGFRYQQFTSLSGGDLRFSNQDQTQELHYEIEKWDTNGSSYIWVQVPALSNGVSIFAFWGNGANATPPAYTTNGSTWAEHYASVHHLNDSVLTDSSGSGFDGQNVGSTESPGISANARHFDKAGNHHINCGAGLNIANSDFTVSAWAKRRLTGAAAEGYIVAHGSTGPSNGMGLHMGFRGGAEADQFAFGFWGNDVNSGVTYPETNRWRLWTATYETSTKQQKLYVDGVLVTSRTAADNYLGAPGTDLRIGSRFDNVAFDGAIDEVRISTLERSSNWIWAVYMNAASNYDFMAHGFIAAGPLPFISNNGGASKIKPHTAQLNGSLLTAGQAPTMVYFFYGESDGGTDKSAWNHIVDLGVRTSGHVHAGVSGLQAETTYYYRYYSTNAFGEHWASATTNFTTASRQLVPEKYSQRMKIRFDGYTKSEILTNFPLLVALNEERENFRYHDFASPAGGDLRFTDADGKTELDFEIDHWNPAGTSFVWVKVPALSSNTFIYAYWGKPGATVLPSSTTNGATWSEHFRAVLHLSTNSAPGTFLDSTSYRLNGTNSGSFDDAGQIGRSRDFNHAFGHHIRTVPGLDISNKSFSISAWAKRFTANSADYMLSHGEAGSSSIGLHFGFIGAGTVRFSFWADDLDAVDAGFGDTSDWHLWTATFDAETKRQTIYRDGVEHASRIAFNPYLGSTSTPLRIAVAHTDASSYFDGRLDEVCVSAVSRSSNWVWACWLNQKSNTAFSTYLPAEKPWADLPELDPASFTHRMIINFDGYTINETLTNFPMLVVLHEGRPNFRYATFASPEGADLRFTDSDGVSELSYEIERWNTAGTSYAWVRVPALSPSSSIYAYWGHPANPAPPTLGLKLWLKADEGVQTNESGSVIAWLDRSGNGNDVAQSVETNMPVSAPVAIHGNPAVRFNGDQRLFKSLPSLPSGASPRTILMVTKSLLGTGDIYPISYGSASLNRTFGIDLGDSIRVVGFGNDHDSGFIGDNNARIHAFVYDGATIEPYQDGAPGTAGARAYDTSLSNLFVGSFSDGGFPYVGDVAEILIYDRELDHDELNQAGHYLEQKYGISTSYRETPYYTADGSTWARDYQTVLHLDQEFLDSSYRGLHTTNFGAVEVNGQISRGKSFNKTFNDHLQGGTGLDIVNKSFTLSTWAKRATSGETADGFFLSHGTPEVNQQGLHFGFRGGAEADVITFAFWGDDLNSHDPAYADTSDWHLWTATYHAGTRRQSLYRNGILMATRIASAHYQGSPSTILRVGEFFGNSYYDGAMDELRIAGTAQSSNWVWACWLSQKHNDTFAAYQAAGLVDRDEDGLPDYWELLHYGNPTNALPFADDDLDGYTNMEEYLADTNPFDSESQFFVSNVTFGSSPTVHFNASTARVYTLQFTPNLPTGPWSEVPFQIRVPGFGENSFLIDTNAAGMRNYRVVVELP